MNRVCIAGAVAGLAVLLGIDCVWADTAVLSPSRVVVLPADSSETARVALYFDVSTVPWQDGRVVDEALLDWTVDGVSSTARSTFALFPIVEEWTAQSAVYSGVRLDVVETDTWDITPLDFERNEGGFVRFDISDAVSQWLAEPSTNLGVVISTPDVARGAWASMLRVPQLTVRYGFH